MPILNYTTQIKSEKTVGEIQAMLGNAGAQAVMVEYEDGDVSAISFRMVYQNQPVAFRLPVRKEQIYVLLQNDDNVPRRLKTFEQATRVAWRIVKDWVEAQLALVAAEQAEMVEVFLPYAQDHTGQTVFNRLSSNGFQLLTAPEVSEQ